MYRHGRFTCEAVQVRQAIAVLVRHSRLMASALAYNNSATNVPGRDCSAILEQLSICRPRWSVEVASNPNRAAHNAGVAIVCLR